VQTFRVARRVTDLVLLLLEYDGICRFILTKTYGFFVSTHSRGLANYEQGKDFLLCVLGFHPRDNNAVSTAQSRSTSVGEDGNTYVALRNVRACRTLNTLPNFKAWKLPVRAGRRVRIYCHLGTYPVFVSGLR